MKIYTEKDYAGEFNLLKMERELMIKVLKMCKGKKSATALIIGMNERTLFNKFISHQIQPKEYFS